MNHPQRDSGGQAAKSGSSSNDQKNNNEDNIYPLPDLSREQQQKQLKDQVKIPIFHPDLNNMGVDELITKSFADIVQKKVDSGEWSATVGSDRQDFVQVQKRMRPAYFWGTATAVSQFCLLRWYGARWMNRSIKRGPLWPWSLLQRRFKNDLLESTRLETNPWYARIETRKDGTTMFREGWNTKPFTIALDATVSIMSGCVVGYVTADKLKLYDAVANIPLKEGHSPVSSALCHDFLLQDYKIPTELWEEHTDDAMRSLRKFLDNCLKRTLYEQQLRRDNMISPNEPVSIPPPGVPLNVLEMVEEQEQFSDETSVDDMNAKRVGKTSGSKAAWSPEDYKFWEEDSEDDWEADDDSENDS